MRNSDTLRRDDATSSTSDAVRGVRLAIEKVARSQAWDIEGAEPFPMDVLPLLQDASRQLARAHARLQAHAKAHVWPARSMHVQRERITRAFTSTPTTEEGHHG